MIPIRNIYYMLSYAFQVLNEQGYKNIETEQFDNVAELCAAILVKGVAMQIYMDEDTNSMNMTSKFDLPLCRYQWEGLHHAKC